MATSSPRKRRTPRKKAPPRQRTESREQSEEGFRVWLDYMADGLKEFFARLPAEVRDTLDFSVESLDVLEAWLLERYPDTDHAMQKSETLILDGAARYIGETFLEHIGGRWDMELDDLSYIYFGIPQITDFRSGMYPLCPLALATTSIHRRRGDFISSLLRIRLANLPEHEQGTGPKPMALSPSERRAASRKRARERAAMRKQWKQTFDEWFGYMAEALKEFFERLPAEIRDKLDYSVESLDVLEAWLLERYPDTDHALQEGETMIIDGAARYVGETFCKVLGGHWWVDVKHDTFLGWPQITGFRSGPGSTCPLSVVTTSIDRRHGDFISDLLRIKMAKLPEHEQD